MTREQLDIGDALGMLRLDAASLALHFMKDLLEACDTFSDSKALETGAIVILTPNPGLEQYRER